MQEAVTSRPWEAVSMLLKEGWLPDRMLNKVSKYKVTKSVSIRLPNRMLNKVSTSVCQ